MNYITETDLRNRRLTQAFRRAAAADRLQRSVDALLDEVINGPVERGFFVSVDHVLVMDRRRRSRRGMPRPGRGKGEMWAELFRQFDAYLASHPGATRTEAACEVVGRGRAPRFFISRQTAKSIIKNTQRLQ